MEFQVTVFIFRTKQVEWSILQFCTDKNFVLSTSLPLNHLILHGRYQVPGIIFMQLMECVKVCRKKYTSLQQKLH